MKPGIRLLMLILILLQGKELLAQRSEEKSVYFTLRMGTGGYQDSRSSIGSLGGGQLGLAMEIWLVWGLQISVCQEGRSI